MLIVQSSKCFNICQDDATAAAAVIVCKDAIVAQNEEEEGDHLVIIHWCVDICFIMIIFVNSICSGICWFSVKHGVGRDAFIGRKLKQIRFVLVLTLKY